MSSRTVTTARATPGQAASTASISPGSIRYPRIFTWSSARPANTSCPPGFHRARSPVRYIRSPPDPNGHATNRSPVSPGRPRYPRASPAPATYSSPATPAGTGPSHPSSTNTRVLATGDPIGGSCSPSPAHAPAVASTVISVGPYRLCSTAPNRWPNRAATRPGSTSPPQNTRRKLPHPAGSAPATNTSSMAGTKCAVVTPADPIRPDRYAGSPCPPGRATTSCAPCASGQNNSHTDTSNPAGVLCSTRSAGPSRYSACIQPSRLATPPWVTATALGTPVDPDVYITYASSPASPLPASPAPARPAPARPAPARPGAVSSAAACSPATSTGTAASTGRSPATSAAATITTGRASASMNAIRSAGYPGSTGRYAAPVFSTASSAATRPTERSIAT